MSYEVTAIKKRPQTFDTLVGQEFIVSSLKNSILQEHIAHAYLFSGPRGVGKTSAARILAKSLNCEQGLNPSPCGTCSSCKEITAGNSLDVIEIDGASHTSVNDVREIRDEVLFSPNSSRYKIYIIDEVHMLSNSAFNALLKTIEEPPPYIVFIFATTEIHKVPATIRSRCQQFNFRLISLADIKDKLKEAAAEQKVTIDNESLLWISKESTGSLRDAYTLFDQIVSFSEQNINIKKIQEKLGIVGIDEISKIINLLVKKEIHKVLELTDFILGKGISEEQFIISLTEFFRNLLFLKNGITKESLLGYSVDSFSQDLIDSYSTPQIEKALELLLNLYRNLRFSLNQKYELELLITRLSHLDTLILPSDILNKINTIKEQLAQSVLLPENVITKKNTIKQQFQNPNIDIIQYIIDAIGKKKLTLASSLKKITQWKLDQNELLIYFQNKDKFSAEILEKEKQTIIKITEKLLKASVKLKIIISKPSEQSEQKIDESEHILKKVFKGTVVKGE